MAAVWDSYRSAGPRQLVISGVASSQQDLDRYSDAVRIRMRPIRLGASPATIEARPPGATARLSGARRIGSAQRPAHLSASRIGASLASDSASSAAGSEAATMPQPANNRNEVGPVTAADRSAMPHSPSPSAPIQPTGAA